MKNSLKKLLALVLVLAMALCFAACGDDKDDDKSKNDENGTKIETSKNDTGAEEQIEAYLRMQQDQLDEIIDTLEEQGIETKIYADGSSLVYEYKLGFEVPRDGIAQFEEGIKSSESQLEGAADMIFDECAAVEEVVYVYYDINNTKLCEISFNN